MTIIQLIAFIIIFSVLQTNALNEGSDQAKPTCHVSLQWRLPPIVPCFHICAGSIIDEQWILTAGHCVEAMKRLLPTGKGIFTAEAISGIDDFGRIEKVVQTFSIDGLFSHRRFNFSRGVGGPYDIGMIKLDKPMHLDDGRIDKVQLPSRNTDIKSGEEAKVYEWGRRQVVTVPIISRDECNKAIEKAAMKKGTKIKNAVNKTNICTGAPVDDVSVCFGDSGGPLIVENPNGQREVVGVASWVVLPCGGTGTPAVWTRVSSYVDWIKSIMEDN